MLRISGESALPVGDLQLLIETLPRIIDGLRAFSFSASGSLDLDGREHPGLQLTSGSHPRRGATYLIQVAGAHKIRCYNAKLDADDRHRFALSCDEPATSTSFRIEVLDPKHPGRVNCSGSAPTTATGWWGGPVSWTATIEAPRRGNDLILTEAQAVVQVKHRRFRAQAVASVAEPAAGLVSVQLEIGVRGRGVLRPFAALAAPVFRRPLRKELERALASAQAELDGLLRPDAGQPASPEQLATSILKRAVDSLAD